MNFDLDDQQRDLASAAGDSLASVTSTAQIRAALDGDASGLAPGRERLAQSGFASITVPEASGGGGGSVLDLAVVAEQAGRVLAAPSVVTWARAAVLLDGDDARLSALADGSSAFAVVDAGAPTLDAVGATSFLALVGDDVVVATGSVETPDPIDPTRGLGRVTLRDTEVIATDARARWDRATAVGRTILAAEGLGTAARAVEMGVEYAKDRVAFGRAIGSYQAVKHSLVDAYVAVEQLRSLVWWAAWTADASPDELPLASAAAKAFAATAAQEATETLIQVHGGIGFTWDHDAHLYWRRAKVDRFLLGDETTAYDDVARTALASA
ncbi:acyl-CoA dehydrogenase family protein [Williamsia deligens]|uniref:Acyl-CoA dehydrogenase family protein n=1 Tax=Williamsia deligens TaxID=321325 RepID=A0ABW3GCJ0_9NOCA|nr:acyl-CoA dehydrogenase [Williamsia deligens]MCP2192580.1 Acyl-CoA dehydrogenase, N-terminal domain [Williamsia deligens]